jgi:hypothetical protein
LFPLFLAAETESKREKKTLFYTVRSEQLLPQTGELLFIPLANLPFEESVGVDFLLFSLVLTPFCPKEEAIESALTPHSSPPLQPCLLWKTFSRFSC